MINVRIKGMDEILDIKEHESLIIIIQEHKLLRNLVRSIIDYDDESSQFVLERDTKLIKIKDVLTISDLFNIDVNSKQIIERIIKEIEFALVESGAYIEISRALTKAIDYVEQTKYNDDIELVYSTNPSDMRKFFKYLGINLQKTENLIDNLYHFISLISELNLCSVLIVTNTLIYFDREEIANLIEFCRFKLITLIIIDNVEVDKVKGLTQLYHIDYDLFETVYQDSNTKNLMDV